MLSHCAQSEPLRLTVGRKRTVKKQAMRAGMLSLTLPSSIIAP